MIAAHPPEHTEEGLISALVVQVAGIRCALPVAAVAEVLPAARVEPVPSSSAAVVGVLSVRGEPVVVVDAAACLGHPGRPLDPTQRFVVLDGTDPATAVRVDSADDVTDLPARPLGRDDRTDALGRLGVALLDDGLVVIHDPATFASAADHEALRQALEELRGA